VLKGDDGEVIAKKTEALATAAAGIAQQAYAAGQGGSGAAPDGAAPDPRGAEGPAAGKDNVVDAEFEEVTEKDKNRRAS